MADDYGARAPVRSLPIGKIAIACGLLILVVTIAASWKFHQPRLIAQATEWNIAGPPCPSITAQAYGQVPFRADLAFDYDDVRFARAFGHVSCDEVHDKGGAGLGTYPVCQFTSPGVLRITTQHGEVFFYPKTGPATISIIRGQPKCVLASRFKG